MRDFYKWKMGPGKWEGEATAEPVSLRGLLGLRGSAGASPSRAQRFSKSIGNSHLNTPHGVTLRSEVREGRTSLHHARHFSNHSAAAASF